MITSTPSRSYHSRAMQAPRSGLFWWSALMTSTVKPLEPNSSPPCFTAATEVGPPVSRYGPDMSLSTPIWIAPALRAGAEGRRVAAAAVRQAECGGRVA